MLDVVLPSKVDGLDLYIDLKVRNPYPKANFMSGYSKQKSDDRFKHISILRKAFSQTERQREVRNIYQMAEIATTG